MHYKVMPDNPNYGDTLLDSRNRIRIWMKCIHCGKSLWSLMGHLLVCFPCSIQVGQEYFIKGQPHIRLAKTDPYYGMTINRGAIMGDGWTSKARYVMAQHLGRCLEPEEYVFHKFGGKDNFNPLMLDIRKRKPHHSPDNWDASEVPDWNKPEDAEE